MVEHACNPNTWEAEAGESQIRGQPWLHNKTLSQKFLKRHQWLMAVILATQKAETRRIVVGSQTKANSSRDPMSKKKKNYKKGLVEWLKQ
jgi:hypothetical protein